MSSGGGCAYGMILSSAFLINALPVVATTALNGETGNKKWRNRKQGTRNGERFFFAFFIPCFSFLVFHSLSSGGGSAYGMMLTSDFLNADFLIGE